MCASCALVLLPGSLIIKGLSSKYNASEDQQSLRGERKGVEGAHRRAEKNWMGRGVLVGPGGLCGGRMVVP